MSSESENTKETKNEADFWARILPRSHHPDGKPGALQDRQGNPVTRAPYEIVMGDFIWGSSQYDQYAREYHNILRKGLTFCKEETGIAWDEIIFDRIRTIEEVRDKATEHYEKLYSDGRMYSESRDNRERLRRLLIGIKRINTIDDCFYFQRNNAGDLWNASSEICDWVFENLRMPEVNEHYIKEHWGVAAEHWTDYDTMRSRTGIHCLLLHVHTGVNEEAFKGFDT